MATTPLTTALNTAIEEHKDMPVETRVPDKPIEPVKEGSDTDKKDDKKDDKKEDKKPEGYGLSDTEIQQAQQLFAALKDEKQAPTVLAYIAEKAGYTKAETKKEAAVVIKDAAAILKEALGPDLDYMSEKLGPIMEKMITEGIEAKTKDLREAQSAREEQEVQNVATAAMQRIAKDVFDTDTIPDDIAEEMTKMMDEMPATPGMPVDKYVKNIFNMVAGARGGIQKKDIKKEEKQQRTRLDAPSRLASNGVKQPVEVGTTTFTNLSDAIKAAIEEVNNKE